MFPLSLHSEEFRSGMDAVGSLGGAAVWCLPLAQGAILETWDRVPRQAPCMEPVSLPLSLSLSVSHE